MAAERAVDRLMSANLVFNEPHRQLVCESVICMNFLDELEERVPLFSCNDRILTD